MAGGFASFAVGVKLLYTIHLQSVLKYCILYSSYTIHLQSVLNYCILYSYLTSSAKLAKPPAIGYCVVHSTQYKTIAATLHLLYPAIDPSQLSCQYLSYSTLNTTTGKHKVS